MAETVSAGALADGPHRAREVLELAEEADISKNTLYRAKDELGVDSFQKTGLVTGDANGGGCCSRRNEPTPPETLFDEDEEEDE